MIPSNSHRTLFGTFANAQGLLFVCYFGLIIAIVTERGELLARNENYPIFLIQYLIEQPTPEKARLN